MEFHKSVLVIQRMIMDQITISGPSETSQAIIALKDSNVAYVERLQVKQFNSKVIDLHSGSSLEMSLSDFQEGNNLLK